MTNTAIDIGLWEQELRHGHFLHRDAREARSVVVEGLTLASRFSPLYSRAHGRPVGHRGTLEVRRDDELLGPDRARAEMDDRGATDRVRALEPGLHMDNYRLWSGERGWLVLAIADPVPRHPGLWPPLPQDMFSSELYAPHHLVLEISADAGTPQQLGDFVAYHQALGFAICLSGFGARHADLGSVWNIRPDMVSVSPANLEPRATGLTLPSRLAALCRVLHESGAMVAVRDVDDEQLLEQVLETDADLLEGRCADGAAEPGRSRPAPDLRLPGMRTLVAEGAERIAAGTVFESACETLISHEGVLRCYLLDADGVQLTDNLSPVGTRSDPRFWPLANAVGARWSHRDYFRSAVAHQGQVMATSPYLSLPDGRHCITLAIAFEADGQELVLCCDMGGP